MSDDLDLRGIDRRHEPDPQFRAALQRRVAAIVAGTDPGSVTETRDLTTIDLEPTTAKSSPSRSRRRVVAAVLAAAATVAAIAVVATSDDDATPADQPVVPPTTAQSLSTVFGDLAPGTYFVDDVAGIPTPRIFATLGPGWTKTRDSDAEGWHIAKRDDTRTVEEIARDNDLTLEEAFDEHLQHDVGVMEFSHPVAVYSDACHWKAGNHPGPLDTVDGLVAALNEQQGWAEVTAPSDISVDGYVGKAFRRTAPADMSDCTPARGGGMRTDEHGVGDFRSWENPEEPPFGWAGFYYEPGWIETLWVLDLDGTIVVVSTGVWPEPSAGADADFADDVLDSIRIERVSPTVTVDPTTPPRSLFGWLDEQLVPGTYFIDNIAGTPTPRILITVGEGWGVIRGAGIYKAGASGLMADGDGGMTFNQPADVFIDACHPKNRVYHRGPVNTLDGLVTALTEQQGWAEVTTPSDISIDGYVGKAFQRTAPTDMSDCDTMAYGPRVRTSSPEDAAFISWVTDLDDPLSAGPPYEPGMIETVWVLDIDGTIVLIKTTPYPEASAAARAEFAAVLDSIRIERP